MYHNHVIQRIFHSQWSIGYNDHDNEIVLCIWAWSLMHGHSVLHVVSSQGIVQLMADWCHILSSLSHPRVWRWIKNVFAAELSVNCVARCVIQSIISTKLTSCMEMFGSCLYLWTQHTAKNVEIGSQPRVIEHLNEHDMQVQSPTAVVAPLADEAAHWCLMQLLFVL